MACNNVAYPSMPSVPSYPETVEYRSNTSEKNPEADRAENVQQTVPQQSNATVYNQAPPSMMMSDNRPIEGRILTERVVEKEMRIPKRIIREEIVEDVVIVRETIIEVAKPVIQETEKVVEVPDVQYKIKEVVEKIIEEKIREVPRIEYCERIVEVPRIITHEKYVEVPGLECTDTVIEKHMEVPEIRENVSIKPIPVPVYIRDGQVVQNEVVVDVERKIPVPLEAVTTFEYQLAQLRPRVTKVQYPMFVPRFIEVPIPAEQVDATQLSTMQELAASVSQLVAPQAMGLRDIENMATEIRNSNFAALAEIAQQKDQNNIQQIIREKWLTGELPVTVADSAMETTRNKPITT